jgi:hypothetical protein
VLLGSLRVSIRAVRDGTAVEAIVPSDETQTLDENVKFTCLDDVPVLARRSLRQQRISSYYMPIALAPFVVIIFVALRFFSQSTNPLWTGLILLALAWAIAVAGYAFYSLFWGVRCPACGSGFGVRNQCRSCGLPRHQSSGSMFSEVSLFKEE